MCKQTFGSNGTSFFSLINPSFCQKNHNELVNKKIIRSNLVKSYGNIIIKKTSNCYHKFNTLIQCYYNSLK